MKNSWMEAEVKLVLLMALSCLDGIATAKKKTTFGSIKAITDTRTMLVDEMNSGKNKSMGANDSSVINEEEGEGRTLG